MSHHADSSLLPSSVRTKPQLWEHLFIQLTHLLEGQRDWVTLSSSLLFLSCPLTDPSPVSPCHHFIQVTNLANTSSIIYHSLLSFPAFGNGPSSVNWCGEPSPRYVGVPCTHTYTYVYIRPYMHIHTYCIRVSQAKHGMHTTHPHARFGREFP